MFKNIGYLCMAFSAVLLAGSSSSLADNAQTGGGLYCHTTTVDMTQPLNKQGECDGPYTKPAGLNFCQATVNQSSEALVTYVDENGDLNFYTSLVTFPAGNLCDIGGVAKKTASGWRYEYGMTDPDPDMHCGLNIEKKANGDIAFTTDPNAQCTALCGMNATMDGVVFPASSNKNKISTADQYAGYKGKYPFVDMCPELPSPEPR
jgi:hypothetical protein